MVATVGSISIDLSTNIAKFTSGFKSAATTVDRESARMSKSIGAADAQLKSFVATSAKGVLGGLAAREIANYADVWTEAGNKIRAAGEISGMQTRPLKALNEIATKTRSGLTETVDLYAKLVRASDGVAKSEEDIARATEIVSKAFKAGGAAANEQAAGILQLGQALGSGILQGDELRSIRENAPLLAKAIADEFGVTIGALKDLGAAGELTSARVFKAILNGQTGIDAAFAQTKATLGDGVTQLKNSAIELVGTLNEISGATGHLSGFFNELSQGLRDSAEAARAFGTDKSFANFLKIFGFIVEEGGNLDKAKDGIVGLFDAAATSSDAATAAIEADILKIKALLDDLRTQAAAGYIVDFEIDRALDKVS
ncbi:MAG: hypothetical protein E5Y73_17470 [Mesorhizobium sp.]|uniref:tape measure protein n=1 Tax=Mesorhizobium sp. TaxID=1871066 RepID=UPI001217F799|nr:tape measure protein [Mesorhizobium sp.]TIL91467.1 MAG: hypothetical protein E5Y73_17470 [Mesorhizobium sp.]